MNYEEMSMEELFTLVEEASARLEQGGMSLEETFEVYREARKMLKICESKIDLIEKKMIVLEEESDEL